MAKKKGPMQKAGEAQAKTQKEKKLSDGQKHRRSVYQKMLAEIRELAAMTNSKAGQRLYKHIRDKIEENMLLLKDPDKTNAELRYYQAEIAAFEELLKFLYEPAGNLLQYARDCPLYASAEKKRYKAVVNQKTGMIELIPLEDPKLAEPKKDAKK